MRQDSPEYQAVEPSGEFLEEGPDFSNVDEAAVNDLEEDRQTWLRTHFEDSMEMYADISTVATHLQNHQVWFRDCALPMQAEPLGENGYDLLIGRFGAFGYLVEARVGLELLPPDEQGLYHIRTIPIPNYVPPGYEVDFRSTMKLLEVPAEEFLTTWPQAERAQVPKIITSARWTLDLAVGLRFPKFVRRTLSEPMLEKTGNGVLDKIVQQVNRRLTYKTQLVFHESLGIPFFPKGKRKRPEN